MFVIFYNFIYFNILLLQTMRFYLLTSLFAYNNIFLLFRLPARVRVCVTTTAIRITIDFICHPGPYRRIIYYRYMITIVRAVVVVVKTTIFSNNNNIYHRFSGGRRRIIIITTALTIMQWWILG